MNDTYLSFGKLVESVHKLISLFPSPNPSAVALQILVNAVAMHTSPSLPDNDAFRANAHRERVIAVREVLRHTFRLAMLMDCPILSQVDVDHSSDSLAPTGEVLGDTVCLWERSARRTLNLLQIWEASNLLKQHGLEEPLFRARENVEHDGRVAAMVPANIVGRGRQDGISSAILRSNRERRHHQTGFPSPAPEQTCELVLEGQERRPEWTREWTAHQVRCTVLHLMATVVGRCVIMSNGDGGFARRLEL